MYYIHFYYILIIALLCIITILLILILRKIGKNFNYNFDVREPSSSIQNNQIIERKEPVSKEISKTENEVEKSTTNGIYPEKHEATTELKSDPLDNFINSYNSLLKKEMQEEQFEKIFDVIRGEKKSKYSARMDSSSSVVEITKRSSGSFWLILINNQWFIVPHYKKSTTINNSNLTYMFNVKGTSDKNFNVTTNLKQPGICKKINESDWQLINKGEINFS